MPKILIVEDERMLAENTADFLRMEGHTVEVCNGARDAAQLLEMSKFDVLILDWQLPDGDGLSICKQFRASGGMSPVLMLTGRSAIDDKELGLDAGADDYLTKPFEFRELRARVAALLRRAPALAPQTLRFASIEVELRSRSVRVNGAPIALLPREYALLEFLIRNPNRFFTTDELIESVWESDKAVTAGAVRQTVLRLRKKLGPDGENFVKSEQGQGYRLGSD